MGFRFRRSVQVLPWVRLNLSKSGVSLTVGPRGANVNISPRGLRKTVGLPGTGFSYVSETSLDEILGQEEKPSPRESASSDHPLARAYHLLEANDLAGTMALLVDHLEQADCAFLAGVLALQAGHLTEAEQYLQMAQADQAHLGSAFAQAGLDGAIDLPITDEISAAIEPNQAGLLLTLAELYQQQGHSQKAIETLQGLRGLAPDDPITQVSLAELLVESAQWQPIVELIGAVENETYIETALLLHKGMALQHLGLLDAALDTLSAGLRRKKDRPSTLLLALQYQRGLVHEAKGDSQKARKDFEAVYADDPSYEAVKQKLGLD